MLKTVCLDARMIGPYGIGTYLKNLIPFLKAAPFKLQLLVNPDGMDQLDLWDEVQIVRVQAPIYSIKEQWKLPLVIPFCDLFWSPHWNIPVLPIRAKKRLVTLHDMYHLTDQHYVHFLQKICVKQVVLKAASLSDHVITNSLFSKGEILRYTQVSEKKLEVIPFGITMDSFQRGDEEDAHLLAEYQLPRNFFLFVGHLRPHKNLKGVLKGMDLLIKEGKEPDHLVVIGKNDPRKKGETQEDLGVQFPHLKPYVTFIGNVDQKVLAACYRRATALVFPSFYEGFGFPPLEAMSAGCPVIVSSAASLPEVCSDAALYVDPHSPVDIARAMKRVLEEGPLRRELQSKGLQRASNLTWKTCAERHINTIERLLKF